MHAQEILSVDQMKDVIYMEHALLSAHMIAIAPAERHASMDHVKNQLNPLPQEERAPHTISM